jgi:hypothetical protein
LPRPLGAAALLLVGAALAACGSRPVPRKVVLVGIDGAEWSVLDRLRAAGRVPVLARLLERGARGSLATLRPTLSPALWTTIATGETPAAHGVENFVTFRPEAELALPDVPPGQADLQLRLALDGACAPEALKVYLDGAPLAGVFDAAGFRARLPAVARGEPHTLLLDLPARCAAAPPPGRKDGPPWGRVAGLTVLGPSGAPLVEEGPEALVNLEHGIRAAGEPGAPALLVGRRLAQVESGDRRVPALWNIASARGRSVGVVGWWCTWPAERVRGTMISDFLFFASTRRLLDLERLPEDALQARAVYPPAAAGLLAGALPARWEMSAEELGRFVPASSPRFPEHVRAPARLHSLADPPLVVLKDTYLLNRPYFTVARRLAAEGQPDLLLVYTNLVDAVEHKFWRYYEPERFEGVSPAELEDFGDTIPRAYAYVDAELGGLLAALAPDTVVLVVSDHGHHAAREGGVFSGEHSDAPPGILIAAGPGIRHGEVQGASLLDVAPTVLAMLALPVPRDLPGHVLANLFTAPPRVEAIATYDDVPHEAPVPPPAELDPAVRERLRALGYLQ